MDRPYAVGIVGSRRRNSYSDQIMVYRLLASLWGEHRGDSGFIIVSGGCAGCADEYAAKFAAAYKPPFTLVEFPINREGLPWKTDRRMAYREFTQRAYARNRLIAEKATELYCLVAPDRTGGTENTIKHALELRKPVHLVMPDGLVYLTLDGRTPQCEPERRLLDLSLTG